MQCTQCDGQLRTVNKYIVRGEGYTKKMKCASCGSVHTIMARVVNTNPGHGEGACALAKQMEDQSVSGSSSTVSSSVVLADGSVTSTGGAGA